MIVKEIPPTFNGRVVLFHEVTLDEPDRQSGLAHSYPTERKSETRQNIENRYREGDGREGRGTDHRHRRERACIRGGTGSMAETKTTESATGGTRATRRTLTVDMAAGKS